jgi:adenine-specific DNA-methyltransferase
MMYPRLKLLKDLLADNGAIFVSIDDTEIHNLRQIMDEIFGEQNFVANIIWQKKYSPQNDAKYFSDMHDFIVVYAKHKNQGSETNGWVRKLLPRTDEMNARYANPDNDPRGDWTSGDLSVKTYNKDTDYPIKTPSGRTINPPFGLCWRVSKTKFEELVNDNRIWFGKDGNNTPRLKRFLTEVREGTVPVTIWFRDEVGDNEKAKKEVNLVLKEDKLTFETPKPVELIKKITRLASDSDSIILDSFAGSGTTGQAVLELNKEDGGNRKFILVELERDIAKKVTSKRIKKVIEGYEGASFPGGTGGGLEYLDLNGVLYDYSGYVNPDAKYEDMAAYIFFTETKDYLDLSKIKNPFIGSQGSTNYFLFFKEKDKNILDEKSLRETTDYKGNKVIYADKCLIDEED